MQNRIGIKQKLDIASYDILSLVKDNLDCLLNDLPSLAYILWKWDRLSHSGRYYKDRYTKDFENHDAYGICENNPKYALEYVTEGLNEKNEDLVFYAWGVSVSNEGYCKDTWKNFYTDANVSKEEFSELSYENIKNRLMQDYPSIFPNDFSIRDHLFCTIGTGLTVSNGNICEKTNRDNKYSGFEQRKDSLPEQVSVKFFEIINRKECKKSIKNAFNNSLSDNEELNTTELYTTFSLFLRCIKDDGYKKKYNIKSISTKEQFVDVINQLIYDSLYIENKYSKTEIIGQLLCLKEQSLKDRSAYEDAKKDSDVLDSFRVYSKIYINLNSIPEEELYPKEYKDKHKSLFENKCIEKHYPCSLEFSLIFKYKKLNEDYKDALIKTAQELLIEDEQLEEVKEECKNLLVYFSEKDP